MGKPQKYRGVRQRHWGSWVSEIRHPLLKTRIWLGTFETAKDAARAYDEAARIMCGSRAKTNFPYDPTVSQSESSSVLSATLMAKLQGFSVPSLNKMMMDYYGHSNTDISHRCKGFSGHGTSQLSTSLTCLRLDTERSNLGIWQQKGGSDDAQSNWVMTVKLPASIKPETEEDIASEMIQELLFPSCDVQFSPDDGNSLSGDVAEQMRH